MFWTIICYIIGVCTVVIVIALTVALIWALYSFFKE